MTRASSQSKNKSANGMSKEGAHREPLSAYPGWDAEEGIFRLDASLTELEERYLKIAEDADISEPAESRESSTEEPAPPRRSARS